MKLLNFKSCLLIGLVLSTGLSAQEDPYEERIKKYTGFWNSLVPQYYKLQYAGSMGMFSLGAGWDYGKDHWETDIMFGLVPKNADRHAMATFTLKQNYIPWRLPVKDKYSFEPLTCGLYLNTLLDRDFWMYNPDRYPSGYYTFSTKVRIHVFAGQRFSFHYDKKHPHRAITFFYELSTCDLYVISAVGNSYLKPSDYLSLSFGLKLQIL